MKDIEINIQNAAQNMIVGSKQHALFEPVRGNNPNLVSGNSELKPEYGQIEPAGERGLEISRVSIDKGNGEKFTAMAIKGSAELSCCSDSGGKGVGMGGNLAGGGIAGEQKGLNSNLYGMLTPCAKQFNVGASKPTEIEPIESRKDESNSGY